MFGVFFTLFSFIFPNFCWNRLCYFEPVQAVLLWHHLLVVVCGRGMPCQIPPPPLRTRSGSIRASKGMRSLGPSSLCRVSPPNLSFPVAFSRLDASCPLTCGLSQFVLFLMLPFPLRCLVGAAEFREDLEVECFLCVAPCQPRGSSSQCAHGVPCRRAEKGSPFTSG